jgi:hypothetical protein
MQSHFHLFLEQEARTKTNNVATAQLQLFFSKTKKPDSIDYMQRLFWLPFCLVLFTEFQISLAASEIKQN